MSYCSGKTAVITGAGSRIGRARLLIGPDAYYISLISRLFPLRYPRLLPNLPGRAAR